MLVKGNMKLGAIEGKWRVKYIELGEKLLDIYGDGPNVRCLIYSIVYSEKLGNLSKKILDGKSG